MGTTPLDATELCREAGVTVLPEWSEARQADERPLTADREQ
jgi:hypothetical protein